MKIITIIGARPQFIKASILSQKIAKTTDITEILVHTGQHYDENMSDIFFNEMGIPKPHYNLQIGSGNHGAQTGKMLIDIEAVVLKEKPDAILVYGDTNSTLAGALVASKLHIPIAHVEAGLRSFNKKMPEEINRILTDHCAAWLFVPTAVATQNLQNEGITKDKIYEVGDIMYDVALHCADLAGKQSNILGTLQIEPKNYFLATIHRAENTDNPERLHVIFEAFRTLAQHHTIILPLHPRTQKYVQSLSIDLSGITLIEPVGYLDMVTLEKNAQMIITDSGGVQKEAFFYNIPCITLRDETEWIELVHLGWNTLVPPTESTKIVEAVEKHLAYPPAPVASPYGDGTTSDKILNILIKTINSCAE